MIGFFLELRVSNLEAPLHCALTVFIIIQFDTQPCGENRRSMPPQKPIKSVNPIMIADWFDDLIGLFGVSFG